MFPIASPPIADGALLIDGSGRILDVGPDARVGRPESAQTIALGEAALLPGLVNAHAHPELAAFRGLLEDLSFPDWIATLLRVRRAAPLDAVHAAGARWTCIECIRAGVTTVAATEDSGAALPALVAAGLRGIVYREVFGPAPERAEPALAELRTRVAEMRREETDLVRVGISPHAPYTVSDALFAGAADYARREDLPIAVHAAESADESALVTRGAGTFANRLRDRGIPVNERAASTIQLLERTGVLDAKPLLIHCVRVDAEDIRRVAESGASVAHCPAANARLGHGVAPLAELLDAGIAVGLGSDSVASNNRIDLLEEARLAQLLQRATRQDAGTLPAARALRLATLGGAAALGLADRIGSLEPGKDADLCAVALTGPHVQPVHDPVAAVVHAARGADVVLTAVRGRVLHGAGIDVGDALEGLRRELDDAAASVRAARDVP